MDPCRYCGFTSEQREYCTSCSRPLAVDPEALLQQNVAGYQIEEFIGEGPIGMVFRATRVDSGQVCRLKLVDSRLVREHPEVASEADQLATDACIVCPGLPRLIEAAMASEENPLVSYDWLAGETLRHRLDGTPMALDDVSSIAEKLLAAAENLHSAGFAHRDIKPGNVLFGEDGKVHLLDIGPGLVSELGRTGGTYRSPEQARSQDITPGTDVYSCGALLYEMLIGRPPFEANDFDVLMSEITFHRPIPVEELRPDVPARLAQVVGRALSPDKAERFPSAGVMRSVLASGALPATTEGNAREGSPPEAGAVATSLAQSDMPPAPVRSEAPSASVASEAPPAPVRSEAPSASVASEAPPAPVRSEAPSASVASDAPPPQGVGAPPPAPSLGEVPSAEGGPPFAPAPLAPMPPAMPSGEAGPVAPVAKNDRGRTIAAALFVALAVVVGGSMLYFTSTAGTTDVGQPESPPPEPQPQQERQKRKSVRITLTGLPPRAQWFVDGRSLRANPFRAPSNDVMHRIRVEAPGHEPFETKVVFREDLSIPVKMTPIAQPDSGPTPHKGFRAFTYGAPATAPQKSKKGSGPTKQKRPRYGDPSAPCPSPRPVTAGSGTPSERGSTRAPVGRTGGKGELMAWFCSVFHSRLPVHHLFV